MKQEEFDRQIECAAKCDSKTAVTAAMSLAYHHPGLAMNWYEKNGHKGQAPSDDGLTEFERVFDRVAVLYMREPDYTNAGTIKDCKKYSKELLSIARKQIVSEIDVDSLRINFNNSPHGFAPDNLWEYWEALERTYQKAINDTLKAIKGE